MASVSNRDILSLLQERDHYSVYHKDEIRSGKPNILKHSEINLLIKCLKNDNYSLTESDVELLREYNIFAVSEGKNIKKDSFIVISDFHGYDYPIKKILQHYLEEYEYIYILGDATDRGPYRDGTGSINLLRTIKKLTELYPGRIVYIPGNHDSFIVGHDKGRGSSTLSMEKNNGSMTVQELNYLKKADPWGYKNLITWLENLPLQRMHKYDGKYYALAHAFFDQNLYNRNPNYDLKTHFCKENPDYNDGNRVLWFRKKDLCKSCLTIADSKVQEAEKNHVRNACPTSDVVMVVGHSVSKSGSRDLDLIDRYGDKVKVHCVDGGIAYNGTMLKYCGGDQTEYTQLVGHVSPKKEKTVENSLDTAASCLKNYIVSSIYLSREEAFSRDLYLMPNTITNEECAEIVDSYENSCGFSYDSGDYQDRYWLYRKILVFDMIIQNLFDKYHKEEVVIDYIDGFFFGHSNIPAGDLIWFTEDRDTRFLAEMLGRDNMIDVLVAYNCQSVIEYIRLKAMTNEKGKVKIKI